MKKKTRKQEIRQKKGEKKRSAGREIAKKTEEKKVGGGARDRKKTFSVLAGRKKMRVKGDGKKKKKILSTYTARTAQTPLSDPLRKGGRRTRRVFPGTKKGGKKRGNRDSRSNSG